MILIGPAGIGNGIDTLPRLKELNIRIAEVEFVHSIYMNNSTAKNLNSISKVNDVQLSIHAPYFINLNSEEKAKIEASKKRILDTCERGHYLGANYIVFHAGFFGKINKQQTFENIKNAILDIQKIIKENNWKVKLAPETTGKISVFGDLNETLDLAKQTNSSFCIDFSHLKARTQGKIEYEDIIKQIKQFEHVHSHFSGIEWTSKGEKNHKLTDKHEAKLLLEALKKHKLNISIINESPNPYGDAIMMNKILNEI